MTEIETINYYLNKMNNGNLSLEEYRSLEYFLIKNYKNYRDKYPITETSTYDNSLLFIADTHVGSEYENKCFIDTFYNYALRNNIKTVIHAGDLIEGTSRYHNKDSNEIISELNKAISYMPKEIRTKLLIGNHDFSAFSHNISLLDQFFMFNNLDILGLGRVFLNFKNIPLGLNHTISDKLIKFDTDVTKGVCFLEGHSHSYFVDENNKIIKIPSLSDELKDTNYYAKRIELPLGMTFASIETKPYLNFIKATFIEDNIILFEEMRQDKGFIETYDQIILNGNTNTLRKCKK